MKYIGIMRTDDIPSTSIGLRVSEMTRLGFSKIILYARTRITVAKQFRGASVVTDEKALMREATSLGNCTAVIASRHTIDKNCLAALGNPADGECRCLNGQAFVGCTDNKDRSIVKAFEYDRRKGVERFEKGDSGDILIDVPGNKGVMAMTASTFAKMLAVGDSFMSNGDGFRDIAESCGVRLVCVDPMLVGVSWHPSVSKAEKKPVNIVYGATLKPRRPAPVITATYSAQTDINEKGKVYIGLASYPAREKGMIDAVRMLHWQCDKMFVSLNEYDEENVDRIRRLLSDAKNVVFTGYTGSEDLGCQNNWRHVGDCEWNDFYLTADDDIMYPKDYVKTCVSTCMQENGRSLMSCHGRTLPLDENGKYIVEKRFKNLYHYANDVPERYAIDVPGGGVTVSMPKRIGLTFETFRKPKGTGNDEILAIFAKENNIPLFVVPHKKGWLTNNGDMFRHGMFSDTDAAIKRREYIRDMGGDWRIRGRSADERNGPFFRIITPVYRSVDTLKRAVASVTRQTFKSYVMVVCDDMSNEPFETQNEKTVSVLGSNGLFIRSKSKLYAGGARNTAMEHFKSAEYTLFLDADDELYDEKCLEDLHSLILKNNFPDAVSLPAWIEKSRASNRRHGRDATTPEKMAMQNHHAPWSKAVRTKLVPKFSEGMRRSNDTLFHFRVLDVIKTTAQFERDFIKYRIDGETTMFGEARKSNIMSTESLSCLLRCASSLMGETWKHDYVKVAVATAVSHIVQNMAPAVLSVIKPKLRSLLSDINTPEEFRKETVQPGLQRYIERHGDAFMRNPRTLQEKIAHIKLFGITKLMTRCADKLEMKAYAKEVLGEDISVPTIMSWDDPDEIDFDMLPSKFALKCNHGCHYNIIVDGKSKFDKADAIKKLKAWLAVDYGYTHGEMQYTRINRKCFAEKYVGDGEQTTDYKFVCFNGKPTYCQVIKYRGTKRQHLNWYDMDWRFVDISRTDFRSNKNDLDEKPASFEKMKEYAKRLSEPFDFVRVDFFDLNGRAYLGELTFTPANANQKYIGDPDVGLRLGSMLKLSR